MSNRLSGKRILITGAVDNIGKESVASFVGEGASVVIADIDAAKGAVTAKELGTGFVEVDVRDEASVERMVTRAVGELGGLDGLCQLAAIQIAGSLETLSAEDWDLSFAVNVRGQFFGAKHAIGALRASGNGSIVNMASVAGKIGAGVYGATKAAVMSLTRSLATELAKDNVRANAVCPGWTDTAFNNPTINAMGGKEAHAALVRRTVPLARQATPSEIAPILVYLLSDESTYMTGQSISIDGGLTMT
ncbi:MAG: SDR family NAD(P)-dependent oxidoreductase [Acidimicrobiales bacterium]